MVIEKLVRDNTDLVTWSIVDVRHERTPTEIQMGIPDGLTVSAHRVEWRGRVIEILQPQNKMIGIDIESGEIVDVKGLW